MREDPASRYEPFLAAGERHFPDGIDELRGWADGSGIPFEDLLTLNLKAELATLQRGAREETPGCSTLVLSRGERRLIAHNEDGHRAYRDLMFLVRVSPQGKPAFLCLTYPGILCGNGPVINEAGIILTTNYIGGLDVRRGVPRYVISRAVLGASSLEEAVAIVTHPERAFSFHYNLGSRREGRILSVETSVKRHAVREVDGLYPHTNHLVLPGMEQTPQDAEYVSGSSMSRYAVLGAEAERLRERIDSVDGDDLRRVLELHDSAPYSPCRHPTDEVSGATLGHALFDVREGSLRLSYSNPCHRMVEEYGV
jgi:isopenicillin-N N-acyltransferase-like protein